MADRRIALVCLTPRPDADELGPLVLPSFGIRRIQAAVVGDAGHRHSVTLIDHGHDNVEAYVHDILAFEPELVGFSIYVWSTPCLIAVAREIKRRRPSCIVVFGGPSARAALFDLEPYGQAATYLDAIVEGDGEEIFREIAALPDLSPTGLKSVSGLTLPTSSGWLRTARREAPVDLDQLSSPFALGLMPYGAVAYLETYRGCPLSCRFCEWGVPGKFKATFSAGYIARELEGFARVDAPAVFLLDAGLNLNIRAFGNLREANRRTGFLKRSLFWAEIYPSVVRDEHLEFMREIGPAYLGVGMQSKDQAVLRLHQRPSDSPRFEAAVRALAAVTNIELQIIFGLPGDSPEGFRRTLDYALSLPASVRAYHCLVLPDALMTRGLPEFNMVFDPSDLSMISCLGWNAEALAAMRSELDQRARACGGKVGRFWWSMPRRSSGNAVACPA
ncbi:MAG TPA: cobalamin-dependent protein [Xanthobacteraceae bacterium]|nr:cobalamin-dependent protein [Xanthobacteraceae bacterium]